MRIEIFASLPGTGTWLTPALLLKFGEDRDRLLSAGPLQVLAGTCLGTYQSDKKHSVRFRRSCDPHFATGGNSGLIAPLPHLAEPLPIDTKPLLAATLSAMLAAS